jgi:hypothetical protein
VWGGKGRRGAEEKKYTRNNSVLLQELARMDMYTYKEAVAGKNQKKKKKKKKNKERKKKKKIREK